MGGAVSSVTDSLFGGSESSQRSQSGMDPRVMRLYMDNMDRAERTADNLQAREIAGFTPDFEAGADFLRGQVGGRGQQMVGQAGDLAQNVANRQFTGDALQQYLNPHTDAVVNQSLSDLDRARRMSLQGVGDQAASAGAFGGSRHGVAEAETNRAFADQAATTSAGLRQQGFDSAADLFNQDRMAQLQGAQTAAGLGSQYQQMGLQGAEGLMSLGGLQQALTQQELDAIRNLPLEQQQIMNQALGVTPAGGAASTSTATGTSSQSPGLLGGAAALGGSAGLPGVIGAGMQLFG